MDLGQLGRDLVAGTYDGRGTRVCTSLGDQPYLSEQHLYAAAVAKLRSSLPDDAGTADVLNAVEGGVDALRAEEVLRRKREQFREVAADQQLIISTAEMALDTQSEQSVTLRITSLRRFPGYLAMGDGYMGVSLRQLMDAGPALEGGESNAAAMPDGLSTRVVLPDQTAMTAAGRERILRGQPFYARFIAHSPSLSDDGSTLTCSAYAVWGITRPDEDEVAFFERYWRSKYEYGEIP